MKMGHMSRRPSLLRRFAVLLVLGILLGAGPSASSLGAQRAAEEEPLDLAAMALIPSDLDDEGLEGYRIDYGETFLLEETASLLAPGLGLSEDEVQETLEDAGFERFYTSSLFQPEDEDDIFGAILSVVNSYVLEFADEEGAAAAWETLEDESNVENAQDVRRVEQIGDETEATRVRDERAGSESLDLSFRLGNLIGGVLITNESGQVPEVGDAEALAERLLERIEEVSDDGTAGMSNRILRLRGGPDMLYSVDNYLLLDGEVAQFYSESERESRRRENDSANAGMTDEYYVWQQIATLGDEQNIFDDVWFYAYLQNFEDEDTASDWLGEAEERLPERDRFVSLEIDEEAPTFGDESITYTVEWNDPEGGTFFSGNVALRVGTTVVAIEAQGPETPPAEVTDTLAEIQVDCLEEDPCPEPVLLPEAFEEFIADQEGNDNGREEAPEGETTRDDSTTDATPESR